MVQPVSVIPGKVDPNYHGDLQKAEAIPGTAFAVSQGQSPQPVITQSQRFQPQYYEPGWNERAVAEAAQREYDRQWAAAEAAGNINKQQEFVIKSQQDQKRYDALVAAHERASRYQQQRVQVEQRIEEERQKNLILGIVPNPLQRFDKPIVGFLDRLPTRRSAKRLVENIPKQEPAEWEKHPVVQGAFGVVTGYAEDVQERPTKFLAEMGIGYGFGRLFMTGGGVLSSLEKAGRISPKVARITPKAVQATMAGGYVAVTGLNVMAAETPKEKGEVIGRSLSELTALGIGAGIAYGKSPVRFGFSTQEVKPKVRTIDLTKTIDVRPEVDFSKAKVTNLADYTRPISKAERAMLIRQYKLSPAEISLARTHKLSINDVLALRTRMEVPPAFEPPMADVFLKQMVSTRTRTAPQRLVSSQKVSTFVPEFNLPLVITGIRPEIMQDEITDTMTKTMLKTTPITATISESAIDELTRQDPMITSIITSSLIQMPKSSGIVGYEEMVGVPEAVGVGAAATSIKTSRQLSVPAFVPFGGAGGYSPRGRDRWEYEFTEQLFGGDMLGDVFGIRTKPTRRRKKR